MFLANLATYSLSHVPTVAAWIFQEAQVGWDPISLWRQMGILAKIVVLILFIMSGWSGTHPPAASRLCPERPGPRSDRGLPGQGWTRTGVVHHRTAYRPGAVPAS